MWSLTRPARLHERVADRRPDEAEAALLQVLAHRLRLGGLGRDLAAALRQLFTSGSPSTKRPEVVAQRLVEVERSRLRVVRRSTRPSAGCGRSPGRRAAARRPLRREARDLRRVEVVERLPVALALAEDRRHDSPACAPSSVSISNRCRSSRERDAPLLVVVRDVVGHSLRHPFAARLHAFAICGSSTPSSSELDREHLVLDPVLVARARSRARLRQRDDDPVGQLEPGVLAHRVQRGGSGRARGPRARARRRAPCRARR